MTVTTGDRAINPSRSASLSSRSSLSSTCFQVFRCSGRRSRSVFSNFMVNTWTAATIVAVVAGVVGFFVVLRGAAFPAHAIPNGAFVGAAGANLVGLNGLLGLAVFAVLAAFGIGTLGRRGRRDVGTA